MSSFVTAMDNHSNRTTIPSKPGTMVRKTLGFDTKSKVLELWTMLKRGIQCIGFTLIQHNKIL